jgi:hypothetical protein
VGLKDLGHAPQDEFYQALEGLPDEVVQDEPYIAAATFGADAVPGDTTVDVQRIGKTRAALARSYAHKLPGRISEDMGSFVRDMSDSVADQTVDGLTAAIDAKLDSILSDVTRYAEPPWGAGQEAYGSQLDDNGVLLDWETESGDPCDDCLDLEGGSPYSADDIPTWPAEGDTECLDNCKCHIAAEEDSWNAAFGE